MFGGLTENDYLCIQLNKRDMATTRPNFWLAILLFLLPTAASGASADTIPLGCPIVKMEAERLPDLNIPPPASLPSQATRCWWLVANTWCLVVIPTASCQRKRLNISGTASGT